MIISPAYLFSQEKWQTQYNEVNPHGKTWQTGPPPQENSPLPLWPQECNNKINYKYWMVYEKGLVFTIFNLFIVTIKKCFISHRKTGFCLRGHAHRHRHTYVYTSVCVFNTHATFVLFCVICICIFVHLYYYVCIICILFIWSMYTYKSDWPSY